MVTFADTSFQEMQCHLHSYAKLAFTQTIKLRVNFLARHRQNYLETATKLFTIQSQLLISLYKKPFENSVGNRENDGNQHFILFPQCFLPFPKLISIFQPHLFYCLQMLSIWTSLKFCRLVKS